MKLLLGKREDNLSDRIIFVILVALFFCFVVFSTYSWGRYVFFPLILVGYAIYVKKNGWRFTLKIDACQIHALVFMAVTFFSSMWAINSADVIEKGVTLLEIFLCFYVFYLYFDQKDDLHVLFDAIKWAGFLIAIYSIVVFGWEGLARAASSQSLRLQNDFANVNSIALLVVLACLIEFWDALYKKDRWMLLFYIPSFLVVFATQSRKAFVFLFLGMFIVVILKNLYSRNILKAIFGILGGILAVVGILILLSRAEAFQGVFERMQGMISSFTGEGKADNSATIRQALISAGFQSWIQNPLGGIGIGCSHYIAQTAVGYDCYLHNNFIEVLSGGGVLGFIAYYWLHIYLLATFIRFRKNNNTLFAFCLPWLLLILILDYGMVSYYDKSQWIYLLTLCLAAKKMKQKRSSEL